MTVSTSNSDYFTAAALESFDVELSQQAFRAMQASLT